MDMIMLVLLRGRLPGDPLPGQYRGDPIRWELRGEKNEPQDRAGQILDQYCRAAGDLGYTGTLSIGLDRPVKTSGD